MEERVVVAFEDLGLVNGARVSVRLVHRRGQFLVDVRKVRGNSFLRQGIELTPDMLRRLLVQAPEIIAKLPQDRATVAPSSTASANLSPAKSIPAFSGKSRRGRGPRISD